MSTPPPRLCYGVSDLIITIHLKTMEATGLAVGVVGLGLQLATMLQTYVEGVTGAEDRLRELSFDVASTASMLKQLEDMLDADKAAAENTSTNQASNSVTIFTDQGRHDIYSLSRRCEKVYQGILGVIVSASSPPSAKVKAIATNVGLSDLTTTRLAQFGRALKWPLIESRVKTCLEELRWLKMDLLLHLQVATVARIQIKGSPKQIEKSEDESTLEPVFERLIARRDTYRKAALEGRRQRKISANAAKADATSEHLLVPGQKTASSKNEDKGLSTSHKLSASTTNLVQPPPVSSPGSLTRTAVDPGVGSSRSPMTDRITKETTRGNAILISNLSVSSKGPDGKHSSRDMNSTLLPGNNRPSPSHFEKVLKLLDGDPEAIEDEDLDDDPIDIEAWTLPLRGRESQRLPFLRGDIIQRIKQATKHGRVSRLDQFLALTPEQRDQAQDLITQLGRNDARPRGYLALETREDEIIVFVGVDYDEQVVYLDDPVGRTWQFPYKDFENWQIAKEQICLLEFKDASLQQKIRDGQFDIQAESGALIPPMRWHQFVKPGETLEMAMWGDDPPTLPPTPPPAIRPALYRPPSSKSSFGKSVLKKLFTLRWGRVQRWRPLSRERPVGVFQPTTLPDNFQSVFNSGITPLSKDGEIEEDFRPSPDNPVGHSERFEVESTDAEVDDEDLFDWSENEVEEELDTAETFSQLLARWTNVDATTS
ncbi:hypothetical protein BHE90_015084 [Fusarium euwallaceae]|uniref:Ubiquitin-like domain-containing protein n=2 Tax=Fusarium solani species complex TaxID=232080 RepID=A0A428TZL1_9HYPO|nr:hypothetical protein CEP52_005253 [Fusarium oligoseptatum]RTE70517.1 hypothetical protein BHE90_015084 [Fusarium euwallaceae]